MIGGLLTQDFVDGGIDEKLDERVQRVCVPLLGVEVALPVQASFVGCVGVPAAQGCRELVEIRRLDDGCVVLQAETLRIGLRGLAAPSAEVDEPQRSEW